MWATWLASVCYLPTTSLFSNAFVLWSHQSSLSCFSNITSLHDNIARGCCLKKVANPTGLQVRLLLSFKSGIAAACLWGQSLSWPMGHMISSLSFRMFMLVFPVCHVLNYEYAENNKKPTSKTRGGIMVSSLIQWCSTLTAAAASMSASLSLSLCCILW